MLVRASGLLCFGMLSLMLLIPRIVLMLAIVVITMVA